MHFLLLALVLCGCKKSGKDIEIPSTLIQKEKMAALMVDIHIAESYTYLRQLDEKDRLSIGKKELSNALSSHKIAYEDFKKSYDWYIDHPQIFESVYADVVAEIKKLEKAATKVQSPKDAQDSSKMDSVKQEVISVIRK